MWKPLCSYWAPFLPGVPQQAGCGRDDTGWASVWATGLWGASGVSSSGGLTMAGNPPAGSSWARWSGGISLTTIPAPPAPAGRPYAYGGLCTIPRCLTNACAVRQYITPAGIRCGFFIICLFYFPVCLTEAVYNFQTAERLLYFVWAHIYSATKTTVFLFPRWVAVD